MVDQHKNENKLPSIKRRNKEERLKVWVTKQNYVRRRRNSPCRAIFIPSLVMFGRSEAPASATAFRAAIDRLESHPEAKWIFHEEERESEREAESRPAVLDARLRRCDAGSAHVVEHQTLIPKVAGSSPNKSNLKKWSTHKQMLLKDWFREKTICSKEAFTLPSRFPWFEYWHCFVTMPSLRAVE